MAGKAWHGEARSGPVRVGIATPQQAETSEAGFSRPQVSVK
jgi:hypothetical protein